MSNTPISNLPLQGTLDLKNRDSAYLAKKFFSTYYSSGISISVEILDATVSFFEGRGFSTTAAQSISTVLLSQAKIDKINVFTLLDTLKGLNEVQLSRIVREVLNYNRLRISVLGDRIDNGNNVEYEKRNILP